MKLLLSSLAASLCSVLLIAAAFGQSPTALPQMPDPTPTPTIPATLTPPAPDTPRINGPSVFGVRPGSPVLYAIPATGKRPMEFTADDLPAGLKLNPTTGSITGVATDIGEHRVTLRAKNELGAAEKSFRIVVGDKIALTPPMGWNSWNCWGGAVSQEKVLSSARAMKAKGLRDHGWTYINLDDGWQGERGGAHGAIQPNSKFPDMQALGDELHLMGLKFGIYSSPWRGTYEGHIGSSADNEDGTYDWVKSGDHNEFFRIGTSDKDNAAKKRANWTYGKISFAEKDVAQWAAWGVDYLKYDWFPNDVSHTQAMADALQGNGRDIALSLSNSALYDLAPQYASVANAWRTTGDIRDTWQSVSRIGFAQDRWAAYAGPGHWNDPDILVVGKVGWGPILHPTRLTPDEQYTHVSLWCLLAAPLLIGCDLAQLDDFTLGLLTNDEVLAIDQDALGKAATQISNDGDRVVYAKTLEDGSIAVGLFNRGKAETAMGVHWGAWSELAMENGKRFTVRDVWRQQDLGVFGEKFETRVAPHGVVLLRLSAAK